MRLSTSKEAAAVLILAFSLVVTLATAAVVTVALTASAAAQEVPGENATETPASEQQETGERIDNNTVILDKSYNPETGRAVLTIRSESLQEVTLSDAGATLAGGRIAQNSVILKEGTTQEVSVRATEVDGFVGVTVTTGTGLYGLPIEKPGFALDVPVENDVLALGVGVVLTPVFGLIMYRRAENREREGVLRI